MHDVIRYLRTAIRNDEAHLANAPLGPRQKKSLERWIASQKIRLKELNQQKREEKKRKTAPVKN